jgi:pimeloyl-ACP methyl ester carboxylesterase
MSETITAQEYWAKKGDVDLYVYRKFAGSPEGKPILFLVHGSSISARPGYDVQVPGRGSDYSMMDQCARAGYDVWTMDHEGYGRSSRTLNNSDIAMAVDDLDAVMPIVERETGRSVMHFYGQSGGSLRAALFAEKRPQHVDRLILDAFTWTGEHAPTIIKRREKLDQWRSSHVRPISDDFMHSVFTRDKPGTSEMIVADAVAAAELALGNTIPTGTYLDMCAHLPMIDPLKLTCPVLMLKGEHDGNSTEQELLEFFELLDNPDKQFAVLPGSAHIAQFGRNFRRFYHIMFGFLELPPRVDL